MTARRTCSGAAFLSGLVVLLLGLVSAPSAWAHGGDESKEGYVLVQQALGHLAHNTGPVGRDLAMEKVDDTLAAADQEGVAIDQVREARSALENNHPERARVLLQSSITEALAALAPATGAETGTTVVDHPAVGRNGPLGRDWAGLVLSVLLVVGGLVLARLFRPVDSIRVLRRRPAGGPAPGSPIDLRGPVATKDAR